MQYQIQGQPYPVVVVTATRKRPFCARKGQWHG